MDDLLSSLQRSINAMDALKEPFAIANIKEPEHIAIVKASTASEVCKRLQHVITDFMDSLKPDEEVGIQLASFGVAHQVIVHSVRALGPNLLIFQGHENGLPTTLVQHISQLNFLLVAVPLLQPDAEPRRKIGFFAE